MSAVTAPGRQSILQLNYFVQRTKDTFRAIQAESDPSKVRSMYTDAVKELTVLRRSAVVNQLYGGWKLAIENPPKDPEVIAERSDS